MQQRHSAPTSANIMIFSNSQPRLQKNRYSTQFSCNRGKRWGPNGRFPSRDCKKLALRAIPPAIAASKKYSAALRNIHFAEIITGMMFAFVI